MLDEVAVNNEKTVLEVPSSVHAGSVECLIKKKYQNDYQLSEKQYTLIREYFDRFQKDELISKQLFKDHLTQVLVEKKKVNFKKSMSILKKYLFRVDILRLPPALKI